MQENTINKKEQKNHIYIFLDEAGDTGLKGSKYFIVVTLLTIKPKEISNTLKRIKSNLKKKEAKKKYELKFYDSSDRVRILVLQSLKRKDIEISYFLLRKKKIIEDSHRLYIVWSDNLIKNSLLDKCPLSVEIILDKRLPTKYEGLFENQLKNSIKNLFNHQVSIKVNHKNSKEDNCLQAADFVSGAVFYNYEHNNSSFYNIIKQHIKNVVIEE